MSSTQLQTDLKVRNHYRLLLMGARAEALANAECAEKVIFAIESLGRFLHGKDDALEKTQTALIGLVEKTLPQRKFEITKKLNLLRQGRNDRMHKGFAARNLTVDAVRVALILEEAMTIDWNNYEAQDLMTPSPLIAHPWYTFGMVRDALIENAYSHLPIFMDGKWHVISDRTVAEVVRTVRQRGGDIRSLRLDAAPAPQINLGVLMKELAVVAITVPPTEKALALNLKDGCVLVVRPPNSTDPAELVGIITPSDVA